MGHDHHHQHNHDRHGAGDERRVFWAMLLTGGFMVAEVVGGIVSGSLALLADAGHMLTDTAALGLAWLAFRIGRRPADPSRSYGYHRFQVLAAFVNGVILIAIVGWIAFEAVRRLFAPVEVLGGMMLAIAVLGLIVNVGAFLLLHGGDRENLNVRGAALHVLGDLLGSLAAIVAAGVILRTGWTPIDPLLSVFVALLILRSAVMLVRRAGHILLEGTPEWLDVARLRVELREAVPAVEDVHHVHVWSLTSGKPVLTLHANVREGTDYGEVLIAITGFLERRFGIGHATIQIEPGACVDERRHPADAPTR
ncbi:MAG TPA: cation diffusion facilitator family transporter [Geminicoccaceae bacterium]|nr:cation diffusion facilitator family transporter [Geminicoccaceae bacterium]